jgi:hypothetical protein
MTRTFLVSIEVQDGVDPQLIANEIFDELEMSFPVISVKTWSSHDAPSTLTPPPVEGSLFLGQSPS